MNNPWSSQSFLVGAREAGRSSSMIAAAEQTAANIKSVHPDLPVVLTLNHLAHLVGVTAQELQNVVSRREDAYRVFRVKKRGSPNAVPAPPRRYRTICVPHPFLMRTQRWIAQNILNPITPHPSSHAFAPGSSLIKAAKQHTAARWLVKLDVRHFFESILEDQVYRVFRSLGYGALLSFQMSRICTRLPTETHLYLHRAPGQRSSRMPYSTLQKGFLPQGAPSSPMLANLAMRTLDRRLTELAQSTGWRYTRYADDLAFSTTAESTRARAVRLSRQVAHELEQIGLISHREKTSIAPPGARKLVLGIMVDREKPRLTRGFRNNIETHLFALTNKNLGPSAHRTKRGFTSIIGMRRHIRGLLAYAHLVDPAYASALESIYSGIDWSR
jgi:RNA-directed DNA polymerase